MEHFSDLARGLGTPLSGDEEAHKALYLKLFFNKFSGWFEMPNPRGLARWSGSEISNLHTVLSEGLKLWRTHVR